MIIKRRVLPLLCAPLLARAQEIPAGRPIRIVTPYGPGSMNDVLARLIAPGLQARLGNPIVIDNRPGASGTIAMNHVARSAPDGLTLALPASSDLTSVRFLVANLGYDPAGFAPIALISIAHNALATPASVQARTLPELIAWLRANPGQTFASAAVGSNAHLGLVRLQQMGGFTAEHVLYRTGAPTALLRGEVTMFLHHELALRPFVEAGTVKLFGVASPERMPTRPDLPTIAEQGFPDYAFQSWFAMVAPPGTPAAILNRVNAELNAVIASPEGREVMTARGVDVVGGAAEVLTARIAADTLRHGNVIRDAGIRPE